jgi:hypothetical protein
MNIPAALDIRYIRLPGKPTMSHLYISFCTMPGKPGLIPREARISLAEHSRFHNMRHPQLSLGYCTPGEVYADDMENTCPDVVESIGITTAGMVVPSLSMAHTLPYPLLP